MPHIPVTNLNNDVLGCPCCKGKVIVETWEDLPTMSTRVRCIHVPKGTKTHLRVDRTLASWTLKAAKHAGDVFDATLEASLRELGEGCQKERAKHAWVTPKYTPISFQILDEADDYVWGQEPKLQSYQKALFDNLVEQNFKQQFLGTWTATNHANDHAADMAGYASALANLMQPAPEPAAVTPKPVPAPTKRPFGESPRKLILPA